MLKIFYTNYLVLIFFERVIFIPFEGIFEYSANFSSLLHVGQIEIELRFESLNLLCSKKDLLGYKKNGPNLIKNLGAY